MQKTITTSRDQREVAVTGELIAESTDRLALFQQDDRFITIELYAVDSGGFVAAVSLGSSSSDIPFFVDADFLDTALDVEHFLYLFELDEVIDFKSERDPHAQRKFVSVYERQAFAVLNALTEYQSTHPDCEVAAKPEPKKRGLLQRLTQLSQDAEVSDDD